MGKAKKKPAVRADNTARIARTALRKLKNRKANEERQLSNMSKLEELHIPVGKGKNRPSKGLRRWMRRDLMAAE